MLRRTGARHDETEGFVNYATSVDGVHVAVLFREVDPGTTRASLRSTGFIDVAQLAAEFGGGGHRNAAGCSVACDLATARARITAAAERHLAARPAAREA
jgi:phosphoesterase RecJ-like protein